MYVLFITGMLGYAYSLTIVTAIDMSEIKAVLCNGTVDFEMGIQEDGYVFTRSTGSVELPAESNLRVAAVDEIIALNYGVDNPEFRTTDHFQYVSSLSSLPDYRPNPGYSEIATSYIQFKDWVEGSISQFTSNPLDPFQCFDKNTITIFKESPVGLFHTLIE